MSGIACGWVLRNGPESKGHKAILLAIADQADIHGERARIGWRTIAERSSYGRSRIAMVVRDLISDGWLEVVEPGGGRGHVAVYRLPGVAAANPRKGPTSVVDEPVKGPIHGAKGSTPEPERVQLAEVIPLLSTVEKTVVKTVASPNADAVALCELLADRVAALRHGARPAVTARWLNDMRLLIERGPLHRDSPEATQPGKIRTTIGFIFDEMADPEGRGAFCWADQIRSPHALRDHWYQMARAAENKLRARRGRSAAAIDAALRSPTTDTITAALTQRPGQLAIGGGQ